MSQDTIIFPKLFGIQIFYHIKENGKCEIYYINILMQNLKCTLLEALDEN